MGIGITAVGAYVPPTVVDNATVAAAAGTTPEWIEERIGILTRRYAAPHTPTSELAYAAVMDLLTREPNALHALSWLILATSTPDQPQPPTAAILQHRLGSPGVPAFDVNAVCAGWLYAFVTGAALLRAGRPTDTALVVAADKYSAIIDRSDPRTAPIFGDGAGAALLAHVPEPYGLLAHRIVTHGEHHHVVRVAAGGTAQPLTPGALAAGADRFAMDGRATAAYVLATLPDVIRQAVDAAGLDLAAVDRFVCHQANPRMLGSIARILRIDPGRVPLTGPESGNVGAASVPLTLAETHRTRPIERGEIVVLAAVGGGLTAGAAVLRWY